ncbi:MAG: glycosyltransferase family 2 protein [Oscillospiraceae bacterium]|nr:glycosyltransferase family 2 protein [Oscillospiraceae bacterium]
MEKLQVLVATMHQKDLSLAEKMNMDCAVLFANQADREEVQTMERPCGRVKMITTKTRGVGVNRNIALQASEGELLLLADDDVVYYDGLNSEVCRAFAENPKADVLIFGMDIVKNGQVTSKRRPPQKRLRVFNALRYGTYTIALRREALLRANLSFHRCFGGGCRYSAGEDSLFLKSCFDKGLKVYGSSYVLGTCCKDSSTWFTSYNEKYFYDKGALVRHLFPRCPWLMAPYFAIRFKRKTSVGVWRRLKLVFAGVRGGKKLLPYEKKS